MRFVAYLIAHHSPPMLHPNMERLKRTKAMPENQNQGSVLIDPREAGAKPPYDNTTQAMPGSEQAMQPRADHGETSYRGCGRLRGAAALITGADSGIGRAVALAF